MLPGPAADVEEVLARPRRWGSEVSAEFSAVRQRWLRRTDSWCPWVIRRRSRPIVPGRYRRPSASSAGSCAGRARGAMDPSLDLPLEQAAGPDRRVRSISIAPGRASPRAGSRRGPDRRSPTCSWTSWSRSVRASAHAPHRLSLDRARRAPDRLRDHHHAGPDRRVRSRGRRYPVDRRPSSSEHGSSSTSRRRSRRAAGDAGTVRFDGIGDRPSDDDGMRDVEIWLPQSAHRRSCGRCGSADGARVEPPRHDRRRWVHYGSSISHCIEADGPADVWPAIAARNAGRRPVAARLRRAVPPRPVRRPHDP